MSEKSEAVGALYQHGADSDFGKHLLNWIEETAAARRKRAGKSEPIPAWGELRFADGLDEVITHIMQMCSMTENK